MNKQAYELGVELALRDAGLVKTSAVPVAIPKLFSPLKGALSHGAAGAAGGGVFSVYRPRYLAGSAYRLRCGSVSVDGGGRGLGRTLFHGVSLIF